ncbi:MAG: protein translocase subunit SecD [Spirochaetaceae bacterium]|jgi:preprotein translocase subunit SecD|nr:protein translocase subunit SecD [Spirochaetaceae bacterium]
MSKRYRFVIILVVIAVCAVFISPTVRWYFLTSKEDQQLALQSREQIKNYANHSAQADLQRLIDAGEAKEKVPDDLSYVTSAAKKILKSGKVKQPDVWDAATVLDTFSGKTDLIQIMEGSISDKIFALKALQKNAVQLGLDLSGGLSIVLQADLDAYAKKLGHPLSEDEKNGAMAQALEVLNSRIDRFGLTEPVIRKQGVDQIYVEIPGNADPERINDIIMGKGSLTFHIVDSAAAAEFSNYLAQHGSSVFDENNELVDPSIIPSDDEVCGVYDKDRYGIDEFRDWTVIKKEVGLDGNHIQRAQVQRDQYGKPDVTFYLDKEGADIFSDLTGKNIGNVMAIVMDGRVKSMATIRSQIHESVSLSGFGIEEANNIAITLRTAALPVELEVANQQLIGASVGADTILRGLYAILGGLGAVMVFLLFFYKSSGINAIVAQIFNLFIMFSVLSAFNFTLTLPSIAGFILTIGMAVDANVIIFERIKEEMALKKSRKAAVEAGFDKAFWAIMDSNITTFIAALFLSQLGSGPIKGFAVSLAIGVFSSVFTALFVSRLMFDFSTDVFKSQKISISWRIK